MNPHLNTGIKDIIQRFPEVGTLLEQYGIGCVSCSVGTCLLKDVVHIHGLPKNQEALLMAKVEKTIYPERKIAVPVFEETHPGIPVKLKYSPPIKKLVEEHDRIKQLLAHIPAICEASKINLDQKLIQDCIYYIRNYADKFHHAKEEDILFKYVDESQDIIQVMLLEHQHGRSFIKSVISGLETNNVSQVIEGLTGYHDLLKQHIQKEDEILYPWFDRHLSTHQVGELSSRFSEVNRTLGEDITRSFEDFLNTLKNKLNDRKEL